ncbi:MAG TPA: DEAD/DEAH box helicase, partial [Myxococcota bacterium]|nr:DEAD/DEAH box helicase [Myxococcota bacterium]
MIRFEELSLDAALLAAVRDAGFTAPTAIQAQAIPLVLAGRDVLGCAQTGTGKTAAFALPIVQRLAAAAPPGPGARPIRALVLSPTRELATQIGDAFGAFGDALGIRQTVVYGGVSDGPQRRALRRGADVLVATPGRLEDLKQDGEIDLRRVQVVVLDESDRMLDQGFLPAVRRILGATPRERQTLLFSATMPEEIRHLARSVQRDAAEVRVAPVATPAERVEQSVFFVARGHKRELLAHLLDDPEVTRALVFTRTKRGADKIAKHLSAVERVDAIHGNRSQVQRERALENFRRGSTRVLVATDLAARGIDVDGISHVINFELPDDSESYVHRIGRTGRAAASGVAYTLCDADERPQLARIERLMRKTIPVRHDHPCAGRAAAPAPAGGRSRP